jgi:hydroxyethylthiazole kinase-like uncharacterized protein yjeF
MTGVMILPNTPDLWLSAFPRPAENDHKYRRGHTIVMGANAYTGATRLASEACSRVGSGLVTVLSPAQADIYRATLPADIMVRADMLRDINRPTVVLAGPGGCDELAADAIAGSDPTLTLVLDADAIRLCAELSHHTRIITPHFGEFERYFGGTGASLSKAALDVSSAQGVTVVLKGPTTWIASPDGRLAENHHASPYLAKAGTGDVLAGLIAGLVAQGMPAHEAACAAVWLHGETSLRVGPGLIPQDLIAELRPVLKDLLG